MNPLIRKLDLLFHTLFVVLALLLLLMPQARAASLELQKLQGQVIGVTAQLNGDCSATIIASRRDQASGKVATMILTAKHCLDATPEQVVDLQVYLSMRLVRKERYMARVLARAPAADLALLQLTDTQTWFAKVGAIAPAEAEMAMGEDVWVAGFPRKRSLTVTRGVFGALELLPQRIPDVDGDEFFRASASIAPGSSGGGLYRRTEAGDFELIGVTSARDIENEFMALYTPLAAIQAFLATALPKEPERKS